MEDLRFIDTERGKKKLIFLGHMYTLLRKNKDKTIETWRCVERERCNSTMQIDAEHRRVVTQPRNHSHASSWSACHAAELMRDIASEATNNTHEKPAQIIQRKLQHVESAVALHLPQRDTLRKVVRKKQRGDLPPEPATLDELEELPEQIRELDGAAWFRYDTGPGLADRLVLFASGEGLRTLKQSNYWIGDGTFKVVPRVFHQLYTLHASIQGKFFPCVYGLLTTKTEAAYEAFFHQVREAVNEQCDEFPNPTHFSSDYELAAINAVRHVFPDITLSGCLFHFAQIMWRRVQDAGLQQAYNQEGEEQLRVEVHSLTALAFLPVDDVAGAFDSLAERIDERLLPVADHLEDYFIRGRAARRGRRRAPHYPIPTWNCYDRVLAGLPRTTNSVEGWHNRLNSIICRAHISLYVFLRQLQAEERQVILDRELLLNGRSPPRKKKKYAQLNERMERVVLTYNEYKDNDDIATYLRRVGHLLSGSLQ